MFPRQTQIVRDGPHENVMFLGDQDHLLLERFFRQVHQVHSPHRDTACCRRVNPCDHSSEGRLSGARRANHCQRLTGGEIQVDAVQDIFACLVCVTDIFCFQVSAVRHLPACFTVRFHQ